MELSRFLRERNIKTTKGRLCILEILVLSNDSVSADNIFEKAVKKGFPIDLSTVYRTLELFFEKDIIDKYNLGEGKYSFKLKKAGHQHVIKCEKCHCEIKVDCPMNQISELIKNKTGFTITDHELFLKGICGKCKDKE